jgi:hypothetical protein
MNRRNIAIAVSLFLLLAALPEVLLAQNPNCTIIVPDAPLTAEGLATPYQLKATDPNDGPCSESDNGSSAFVQAAIFDPATGQISIYNPLVTDQGTVPAISPVVPELPDNAIVALWFGFNGDQLTQEGASPGVLEQNNCVNGASGSIFGQFSYCNAPAFFRAANRAIRQRRLRVPWLGRASDGLPCPTVRDFYVVDQDQSDNLPVTYLVTAGGLTAQNTQANAAALSGATTVGNPSDNGLLDRFLDPALGCTPWKVSDLADPGQQAPGLALNELQAKLYQGPPVALIPVGDPMALSESGGPDLKKTNAYRLGVDQPPAFGAWQADTSRYCRNMLRVAPERLLLDQALLAAAPSPDPAANSLFTFLAQRFNSSLDILGCADLVKLPNPVSVTTDDNGVAVSATINLPVQKKCQRGLAAFRRWDDPRNAADARAAASTE